MQSSCILKFGNITIIVMVDSSLSVQYLFIRFISIFQPDFHDIIIE